MIYNYNHVTCICICNSFVLNHRYLLTLIAYCFFIYGRYKTNLAMVGLLGILPADQEMRSVLEPVAPIFYTCTKHLHQHTSCRCLTCEIPLCASCLLEEVTNPQHRDHDIVDLSTVQVDEALHVVGSSILSVSSSNLLTDLTYRPTHGGTAGMSIIYKIFINQWIHYNWTCIIKYK